MLTGCSFMDWYFEEEPSGTAQELAWMGMDSYEEGDYGRAVDCFEKIKDWYPFSKFAILAELKVGDAHYHLQNYEDAVFAYEEFENLHPTNDAIPYIIYQLGLCYFDRMDSIDRDQSMTQKALDTFYRLNNQFPDNEYALKSREHIKRCLKDLARHELYIAMYYYKGGHYKAALHRFQSVLIKYPDAGVHQTVIAYINICEKKIKEEEKMQTASSGGWNFKRLIPFMSEP